MKIKRLLIQPFFIGFFNKFSKIIKLGIDCFSRTRYNYLVEVGMKKFTKTLSVILVTIIIATVAVCAFSACSPKEPDRAIIYVTALFSGGLYDSATGKPVWDPLYTEFSLDDYTSEDGAIDFLGIISYIGEQGKDNILGLLTDVISNKETSFLRQLTLDQDGNGLNPNVVPTNGALLNEDGSLMDSNYGVLGIYKPFFENLSKEFPDENIHVFNYDWRLSPADGAMKLEKFINDNDYDEVILISHSMGGSVVSSYLARSEENRDKIISNIMCAPATLGAFDALMALTDVVTYLDGFIGGLGLDEDMIDTIKGIVTNLLDGTLGEFLFNNVGLMHLCPTWEYMQSAQYPNAEKGILIDGVSIKSADELYDFYYTRDWAYYRDANGEKIPDSSANASPDGYKLKPGVLSMREYHESLFIDGVYVGSLVDTYYLLGTNSTTIEALEYNSSTDSYSVQFSTLGDGCVPLYSSTAGLNPDSLGDKVIKYEGIGHVPVGLWPCAGEDVVKIIKSKLD